MNLYPRDRNPQNSVRRKLEGVAEPDPTWQPDPRDFERSLYEGLPKQRTERVDWTLVLVAVILAMLMVYSSFAWQLQMVPHPIQPTPMPSFS